MQIFHMLIAIRNRASALFWTKSRYNRTQETAVVLNEHIMAHLKRQRTNSPTIMNALLSSVLNARVVNNLNDIAEGSIAIGTHDGSFHCDEALAISMLKLLPEYSNEDTYIVRSRNPDILARCQVVVDVGAVYDPSTHRYDHHQREFTGVLDGFKTKLSSAGLIYKHFGKNLLSSILSASGEQPKSEFVDVCYTKLYKDFMEHVDAIDNGIAVADGEMRYNVSSTLSSRVGMLNPSWNEEQTAEIQNEQFKNAMFLTCSEFLSHAQGLAKSWWPARSIVKAALDDRLVVHSSGQVIILSQACPWKDHLFELESVLNLERPVVYAVYQDMGGSWRIQAVPVTPNSFDSRKKLPAEWCGLRDAVLSEKCGEAGAIFIHASGFIGGHATKEGAVAMAVKALTL